MQLFLEKLLMFVFYTVLLIFKMFGWLVKAVVRVVIMMLDLRNKENETFV